MKELQYCTELVRGWRPMRPGTRHSQGGAVRTGYPRSGWRGHDLRHQDVAERKGRRAGGSHETPHSGQRQREAYALGGTVQGLDGRGQLRRLALGDRCIGGAGERGHGGVVVGEERGAGHGEGVGE